MLHAVLLALAGGFAVVTGSNDGSAMLATGLRSSALPVLGALLVLAAAVILGPLMFGVGVAETFAHRLVSFHGVTGQRALLIGIVCALLVVLVLTRRGLPTSLTMAVVGGLAGAGTGLRLPVSWANVATVLGVGMAAPAVGALAGFFLGRAANGLPATSRVQAGLRVMHPLAFVAQSMAYAVNDAQKMLAVFAAALGIGAATDPLRAGDGEIAGLLVLIAALFSVGVLLSLHRMARSVGGQIVVLRSMHMISAQLGATGAVMGSAAIGIPVSMTQSVAAGLVGAGMSEGMRRVRWRLASRIVLAWFVTVPVSVALAMAVATLVRWLA